jgi:hypothetical protein
VKVSEAKAICPHFNPVRKPSDGRIACRFALPDDMCRHDQHFLCDLKQITKAPKKYLSVSRIKLWEECPRKWAFRYAYHLDPPDGRPLWAYVGSAFATARAKIDAGQEWEIPDDVEDEVERIKLGAVMKGYMQLPKMVDKSEVRVETLLDGDRGLWLLGYLDGITENETTIYEWKFTAMPANWNILTVHMQGAAYLHAVPKAEMLILALAKKPSRFKPRVDRGVQGTARERGPERPQEVVLVQDLQARGVRRGRHHRPDAHPLPGFARRAGHPHVLSQLRSLRQLLGLRVEGVLQDALRPRYRLRRPRL